MDPAKEVLYIVRAVIVVAVCLSLWWAWWRIEEAIRGPVIAQRDAAIGANHGMKQGAEANNRAIEALHKGGEVRKAKSAAAVKAAGKEDFRHAKEIAAKPAAGETPLARAANRINAEFGH